jgi:hypothetical protein
VIVSQAEIGQQLVRELRTVLAQLELCSHVQAVNLEPSSRDSAESIGGKCPPGGRDRGEDGARVEPAGRDEPRPRVLRSAEHYRRRIAKAHGRRTLELILVEATDSLEAWRRQPAPTKKAEPKLGDPGWKRYVAESPEKANELAARFVVSRAYIEKVRRLYRDEEAA